MSSSKKDDIKVKKEEKEPLTNEEKISLISIFFSEWKYRDEVLWKCG